MSVEYAIDDAAHYINYILQPDLQSRPTIMAHRTLTSSRQHREHLEILNMLRTANRSQYACNKCISECANNYSLEPQNYVYRKPYSKRNSSMVQKTVIPVKNRDKNYTI